MTEARKMATTSSMRIQSVTSDPQELGGAIVVYHLYTLLRAATMYEAGHPQVTQQAARFIAAVRPQFDALGSDSILLVLSGSHIFVNRVAVRADAADYTRTHWLSQQLGRLHIVEIELKRRLTDVELADFCRRFASGLSGAAPFTDVRDLENLMVITAAMDPSFEQELQGLLRMTRYPLLQLYAEGLSRAREWAAAAAHASVTDTIGPKRVAGQIVDGFHVDAGGMLGLVQLRPFAADAGNRRFDSAIVAAGIALHAGLSDGDALEVAVCALTRPLPEQWLPWWQRHPRPPRVAAAIATRATTELQAITAYESMAPGGVALSPEYYGAEQYRHAAALILGLAEAYVELLDPGAASSPFSPEMAIQLLIAQSGTWFDADLVRTFVSLVGFWPPGTTVQLNSGDLAVVVEAPPVGSNLGRPTVRLIDILSTQVYPLWKPELSAYGIVRAVAPSSSPLNPRYVFLR
jgi:hypothetical protein